MEADEIVRRLAAVEPGIVTVEPVVVTEVWACGLCVGSEIVLSEVFEGVGMPGLRQIAFQHDEDCPLRLAREWVAEHPA